jgi:hypothetical protein
MHARQNSAWKCSITEHFVLLLAESRGGDVDLSSTYSAIVLAVIGLYCAPLLLLAFRIGARTIY